MENTDKVKILFCNIGWMKKYDGKRDDDRRPEGGGSYNKENIGHEVCNFSEIEDYVYGYAQTHGDGDDNIDIEDTSLNLKRITGEKEDEKKESVSGVTVVWTAKRQTSTDRTVIVGWYNNAKVFYRPQPIPSPTQLQEDNNISHYKISALASDAILLLPEERNFRINKEKNFMVRTNTRYAYTEALEVDPEDKNTISEVIQYIKFYNEGIVLQVHDSDMSASEGNSRVVSHIRRERNPKLVKAKKDEVLKKFGKLCCEVCDFDFAAKYGELGNEFCEAHHLKQLSKIDGKVKTKLEDLAIVCSNCHRIIHQKDPMLTIEKLKEEIAKVGGA